MGDRAKGPKPTSFCRNLNKGFDVMSFPTYIKPHCDCVIYCSEEKISPPVTNTLGYNS